MYKYKLLELNESTKDIYGNGIKKTFEWQIL